MFSVSKTRFECNYERDNRFRVSTRLADTVEGRRKKDLEKYIAEGTILFPICSPRSIRPTRAKNARKTEKPFFSVTFFFTCPCISAMINPTAVGYRPSGTRWEGGKVGEAKLLSPRKSRGVPVHNTRIITRKTQYKKGGMQKKKKHKKKNRR